MKKRRPLKILEVMDIQTGQRYPSNYFLSGDDGSIFKLRRELSDAFENGVKTLVCPLCISCLKLRGGEGTDKKQLHFYHIHDSKDTICPLDEGEYIDHEAMRAIIYNGVKESDRHKFIKNFIATILCADNSFSNVEVEELFSQRKKNERRKPDVQSNFREKTVVFEVQLSSDFLTVISAKERYYRSKGAYLIWIFDKFSLEKERQNFTEKDIFYSNNRNAFLLDKISIEASIASNKLHLLVIFERPFVEDGAIKFSMEHKRITIDDIFFSDEFTVFYNDFETQFEECKQYIYKANVNNSRENIFKIVKTATDEEIKAYISKTFCCNIPDSIDSIGLLATIVSAIEGTPCRSGFSNNKQIYNLLLNNKNRYPPKKFILFHAISCMHGTQTTDINILHKIDSALNDLILNGESSPFYPRSDMNQIISKLFPEEFAAYIEYWDGFRSLMNA